MDIAKNDDWAREMVYDIVNTLFYPQENIDSCG